MQSNLLGSPCLQAGEQSRVDAGRDAGRRQKHSRPAHTGGPMPFSQIVSHFDPSSAHRLARMIKCFREDLVESTSRWDYTAPPPEPSR